eukprot:CAMPEP_0206584020 /NCGR_PEP_ID=MMETSP0325_2-20121206/35466_1 /ASSEMBLY_ACC=CAM_ASM_000347 /TAXON_ID=2866 /ORGANISM="Crypthecodinium cohnii, Strain Seligo" /LENGTH=317 /DNA_ID=CAMNT_0054091083 /DNA_START=161 /DNA_END=1111 /DNA_ORIENTATION=+
MGWLTFPQLVSLLTIIITLSAPPVRERLTSFQSGRASDSDDVLPLSLEELPRASPATSTPIFLAIPPAGPTRELGMMGDAPKEDALQVVSDDRPKRDSDETGNSLGSLRKGDAAAALGKTSASGWTPGSSSSSSSSSSPSDRLGGRIINVARNGNSTSSSTGPAHSKRKSRGSSDGPGGSHGPRSNTDTNTTRNSNPDPIRTPTLAPTPSPSPNHSSPNPSPSPISGPPDPIAIATLESHEKGDAPTDSGNLASPPSDLAPLPSPPGPPTVEDDASSKVPLGARMRGKARLRSKLRSKMKRRQRGKGYNRAEEENIA